MAAIKTAKTYVQIGQGLEAFKEPFAKEEIPFMLMGAIGASPTILQRYREGKSTVASFDGLLVKNILAYRLVDTKEMNDQLEEMKTDRLVLKNRPAIIAVSDGEIIKAFDPAVEETYENHLDNLYTDYEFFSPMWGVRKIRNIEENDADVKAGEQLFYDAGCHLCHVTTLHTKTRGSVLLAGTALPWLGGQTIHPYSDFLLHDMGSEIMGVGLNDNFVSGLARGNEWRTTPLWGVGLQKKVNGHTYFLHDGRARNFVEAIMWHGGEGEASKNKFKNMSKKQRDQLVQFLGSL
jgi:hypothetical protein